MRKLLILSDLHAYRGTPSGSPPSHLKVDSSHALASMFSGIVGTLQKEGITPDLIICPGDLADKADPVAQSNAWAQMEELKTVLGASQLIGTAGNHDVDSRLVFTEFDPKGVLQSLQPAFPGGTEIEVDRYWARNFVIYEFGDLRIVNLNSAAFHGIASDERDTSTHISEYKRGRVSKSTVSSIVNSIKNKSFKHNVLLTHHHVRKNDIYERDDSDMIGAAHLLRQLEDNSDTPWLVIHGHQHYPEVEYASGGSEAAIVFSAGSFAARIEATFAARAPNQFYFIEICDDATETGDWSPCGTIKAWHWVPHEGWSRSPANYNIPYGSGFGCRENNQTLATKVVTEINGSSEKFLTLKQVLDRVPQLKFVLPSARRRVLERVEKSGIVVALTDDADIEKSTLRKSS
ncbi:MULTISPECIES: metallophosphoesterase family protein [Agrobacterium tumefaciens complex]|uniref:Calcineurin-like phosphoesterase domain-containing protein n=1 Tax=Agrobacterium genomosp. 13 str. CFBP 6927 TaxID=1183428 RepID=A0ABM9VET1_9HYPH|nr:metallophosphoesterase family protein [Agrobacterium genomosp. 13]CUX24301.1 conserved hypothetical protein [Agrobacterium genomosp. 13 str. CFBP 6927]